MDRTAVPPEPLQQRAPAAEPGRALVPRVRRHWRETMGNRSWLYRQSRMLHAYLSAFAFLTLMFFSVTGLLLNHPEWFDGASDKPLESRIVLSAAELNLAQASPEPGRALAQAVGERIALRGGYRSAELLDDEAHIRLEGVSGRSDVVVNLKDGSTDISVRRATLVSLIGDLHRGKNSGLAWQWLIDVSAVLILALSLLGYVLFFSMKFRLGASLKLTAASLLVMLGLYFALVP
jgi:hypothetical protein